MKNIRTAKFQDITYSGKWGFKSTYPFLRLSGRWLEDAGFGIYETCQIKVSKNKLVITKIKLEKDTNKTDFKTNNAKSKRNETKNVDRA
ncbi:Toxin SymE, type I toxin-antitoxin system [Chitinophaga sp. CF118]|uniref:SymE family type I addiction module toxin n=1 Tax=Chitinophaga sp. CF118 TaxID=1884367 RepID=UPI0008DFB7F7|nr:SymE family type I addiction module toxin [Chitinophaga sp. CF118]SFD83645.1 Toxin SymE, type I toxin-antitoxin system [Chitinophaga sp. CF118]